MSLSNINSTPVTTSNLSPQTGESGWVDYTITTTKNGLSALVHAIFDRIMMVVEAAYFCFRFAIYDPLAFTANLAVTLIKLPPALVIGAINLAGHLVSFEGCENVDVKGSFITTCVHLGRIFQYAISALTFLTLGVTLSPFQARVFKHYVLRLEDYKILEMQAQEKKATENTKKAEIETLETKPSSTDLTSKPEEAPDAEDTSEDASKSLILANRHNPFVYQGLATWNSFSSAEAFKTFIHQDSPRSSKTGYDNTNPLAFRSSETLKNFNLFLANKIQAYYFVTISLIYREASHSIQSGNRKDLRAYIFSQTKLNRYQLSLTEAKNIDAKTYIGLVSTFEKNAVDLFMASLQIQKIGKKNLSKSSPSTLLLTSTPKKEYEASFNDPLSGIREALSPVTRKGKYSKNSSTVVPIDFNALIDEDGIIANRKAKTSSGSKVISQVPNKNIINKQVVVTPQSAPLSNGININSNQNIKNSFVRELFSSDAATINNQTKRSSVLSSTDIFLANINSVSLSRTPIKANGARV